jgi:membrane protein DedA with SNARE-associated domain
MLEPIVKFLSNVPWEWVLAVALLLTFAENLFPPTPSDTILIFSGTLVGLQVVGFIPLVVAASIGSTIGFVVMYRFGVAFGDRLVKSPRFKFINEETIKKPEQWLKNYGYLIIVANRFLTGTRAVVSFVAGMYKMRLGVTIFLSAVSALIWNSFLIYIGLILGANWRVAEHYMKLYGSILIPALIVLIIAIIFIKYYFKKKKLKRSTSDN